MESDTPGDPVLLGRTIVVLGPPHSGVRLVSGLLHRALHSTDRSPSHAAALRELREVNLRLLARAGSTAVPSARLADGAEGVPPPLRGVMKRIVAGVASTGGPPVLGDPLLVPLWRAWANFLPRPVFVWCSRCPLSVAEALRTREGVPMSAGVGIWERYVDWGARAFGGERPLVCDVEAACLDRSAAGPALASAIRGTPTAPGAPRGTCPERGPGATDLRKDFLRSPFSTEGQRALYGDLQRGVFPPVADGGQADGGTDFVADLLEAHARLRRTACVLRAERDAYRRTYERLSGVLPIRVLLKLRRALRRD
jgi:hypothetical protein